MIRSRRYFRLSYLFISADILLLLLPCVTGDIAFFFAGIFLGSLLILLYTYAAFSIRYVRINRSHNESAVEGEEFYIDTAVANFSYIPVFYLEIHDTCLPARTMSADAVLPVTLLPRSVYEYTGCVYITKKMGIYVLGPAVLTVTDPLGIFSVSRNVDHITHLTVYPAIDIPKRLSLMEYPFLKSVGEEIVSLSGHSSDFRGIREFRKGDSRKTVHWRSTARHRRLMAKEFEENSVTEISIFIDCRRIALRGTGNLTTLALALNTGASVAAAASMKSHRFAVSYIGFRDDRRMPVNAGIHHLHLVLHSMVSVSKPGKYSDYCIEVRDKLASLKTGSTAVCIVSQTSVDPAELINLVSLCMKRRIKPVIILIDDRTFIKVYPEQMEIEHSAVDVTSLKRSLEIEGASVYVLAKRDIPSQKLHTEPDMRVTADRFPAKKAAEA